MKYFYLFLLLLPLAAARGQTANHRLNGRITDSLNVPIAGATVKATPSGAATFSDTQGRFKLLLPAGSYRVTASFIGFSDGAASATLPGTDSLRIILQARTSQLSEVTVSTGYQQLPRERATGSFATAGRTLLERSVSTDIVDRLRDVVPGLSFNNTGTRLSVRGQSTLFSNAEPLIVVDGFPYNQPIENLNPNDVENITVLKDAAAASIWGSRAGNGVIVITTKRGAFGKPASVSFSSSVNVGARPDLRSLNRISATDYIDIEKRLFAEDYFTGMEQADGHPPLSPVVELLIAARDGAISQSEADKRINALRNNDVRDDISRYLYRPAVSQQYALSLDGGSSAQRYFFSTGYDRNLDNQRGNGFDRLTLNGSETWRLLHDKLELSASLNLAQTRTDRNAPGNLTWNQGNLIYPYASLKDANGKSLAVTHNYRESFLSSSQAAGLLPWDYSPLDELALADNRSTLTDARINTGLRYTIITGLSAELRYQYDHSLTQGRNLHSADSYFTRDLINRYTQDDGSGTLSRPIPLGSIYDLEDGGSVNHDGRLQLNFDRSFGTRHALTAIAGYEVQSLGLRSVSNRLYGYDDRHAVSVPVDGTGVYTYYDNPNLAAVIPQNAGMVDATDHYLSYYANAAYTYDSRLTFSASGRLDRSNLFGVNSNQKGVPLWSAGAAWDISKEKFYAVSALPYLKLRATLGYSGNINKSLSAYTTATYFDGSDSPTALPYAQILNPPNPDLRWERIRMINLGVDFGIAGDRLTGSLDVYTKRGLDLIGQRALPPSSGQTVFTGNTAMSSGRGFDLMLESRNLTGKLRWNTVLLVSRVTDKVSAYGSESPVFYYLLYGPTGGFALQGKPLYAIYSYQSAGLDPATGDPRGYVNGAVSKDYAAILGAAAPQNLVYNGSSRPTTFGSFRNTFSYGAFSLSANVSYKLGYFFRRSSVRYGAEYGLSVQNGDYARRWQQPGDEAHTTVPSIPAAADFQRDDFYTYSSALVEKGDHVRLQDLRLAWDMGKGKLSFAPGARLQLYVYAANLGIIWRANHAHLDPDLPNTYPQPLTVAGGLRFNY